jgi:hypothetical protein
MVHGSYLRCQECHSIDNTCGRRRRDCKRSNDQMRPRDAYPCAEGTYRYRDDVDLELLRWCWIMLRKGPGKGRLQSKRN